MGGKVERERLVVELVGDQSPSPEAPSRSKRERSKGDVKRGETARGAMEKSWHVRIIERKKIRGDDPIKYFLPAGTEVLFESHRK